MFKIILDARFGNKILKNSYEKINVDNYMINITPGFSVLQRFWKYNTEYDNHPKQLEHTGS